MDGDSPKNRGTGGKAHFTQEGHKLNFGYFELREPKSSQMDSPGAQENNPGKCQRRGTHPFSHHGMTGGSKPKRLHSLRDRQRRMRTRGS